jgi:hypothetical protein
LTPRRAWPAALALLLTLLFAPGQDAARAQPTAAAIKAAFLPKFARYVDWPAANAPAEGRPYQLCLIGQDPFGPLVDRFAAGEQIDGHPVAVHRMAEPDAAACHVAFVEGRTPEETRQLLAGLHGHPVLTITDARAGSPRGMIHFTVAGGRVRFFIDQAAAMQEGLTISSRLLALALSVRENRP